MNKYFKIDPQIYKDIRIKMDQESGYPSLEAETWFAPIEQAPKDENGSVLIAAIYEIAEEFIKAGVPEISKEEYTNSLQKNQQLNNPND